MFHHALLMRYFKATFPYKHCLAGNYKASHHEVFVLG